MGYDSRFLGVDLPLPNVRPEREGDVLHDDVLTEGTIAEYPNCAVVTDAAKRSPVYAVLQIDRSKMHETKRSNRWRIDSRIGSEFQLDNAYYGNNPWDRGHMARRASAGWGNTAREAQKASDETFYYSNACLQHENVNQDEWLALEEWVADQGKAKDGKIVVYSGPVYGDFSRTIRPSGREPAEIPSAFFKVVCFVNSASNELDVRAFLVLQDGESMRDKNGRKTFDYQKYQVTIREIEELTGLDFPDEVYEKNPLYYNDRDEARALGVNAFPERVDVDVPEDIISRGDTRKPIRDDEVQVYLAAAQIAPKDGGSEWVSVLNLESVPVDLTDWTLADRHKRTAKLSGTLQPGEAKVLASGAGLDPVRLPNEGGLIVLRNAAGEQVDRIEYTEQDLRRSRLEIGDGKPMFFATYRRG